MTSLVAEDLNRPIEVGGRTVSRLFREMVTAPGRWATTTNQEDKGPRVAAPFFGQQWMVVTSRRSSLSAAAVRKSVQARAGEPKLSTPALG